MAETMKTSSGVQELIDRIRDQGVEAAQEESNRLLHSARQQAAEIVAQAKSEAEAMHAKATAEVDAYRAASMDGLRLAARDTVLDLKAQGHVSVRRVCQASGRIGHARQRTGP